MKVLEEIKGLETFKRARRLQRSCKRQDERLSDNRIWLLYPRNSGAVTLKGKKEFDNNENER